MIHVIANKVSLTRILLLQHRISQQNASLEVQEVTEISVSDTKRTMTDYTRDAIVDFVGGVAGMCQVKKAGVQGKQVDTDIL